MFRNQPFTRPTTRVPLEPPTRDGDKTGDDALHLDRVVYDARLLEEAVLRVVRARPAAEQQRFHRQRDVAYEVSDPDAQDRAFGRIHQRWFVQLALGWPLQRALADTGMVLTRASECRVTTAVSRKDEVADLFDWSYPGGVGDTIRDGDPSLPDHGKVILVRLRPESFLEPRALLRFLRHELMHVADMLDPSFGYQKQLPVFDTGPSYDNILRHRYRVVWDTSIDGRLFGRGVVGPEVRQARHREFAATFQMLGEETRRSFSRWFSEDNPAHDDLVAFVCDPRGFGHGRSNRFTGRCPICRFPTAALDPHPERLTEAARTELKADHPSWNLDQGLCAQCADLYQARMAMRREAHEATRQPMSAHERDGERRRLNSEAESGRPPAAS